MLKLQELCWKFETHSTNPYQPSQPPRRHVHEIDLVSDDDNSVPPSIEAFQRPNVSRISDQRSPMTPTTDRPLRQIFCWNCTSAGHTFQNFHNPQSRFFCYLDLSDVDIPVSVSCDVPSISKAKLRSIEYWRNRKKIIKEISSASFPIESCVGNDPRPYATIKIFDQQIQGLLDSGASVSCLGSGCQHFLASLNRDYCKIQLCVWAADGSPQDFISYNNTDITYKERTKRFRF